MDVHSPNGLKDQQRALDTSKVEFENGKTASEEEKAPEKAGEAVEEQAGQPTTLDGDQR